MIYFIYLKFELFLYHYLLDAQRGPAEFDIETELIRYPRNCEGLTRAHQLTNKVIENYINLKLKRVQVVNKNSSCSCKNTLSFKVDCNLNSLFGI